MRGNWGRKRDIPVSQICALMVLESTTMLRVANSTPIVDLDSMLNSFRVNLDSTGKRTLSSVTAFCYHHRPRTCQGLQFLWKRKSVQRIGRISPDESCHQVSWHTSTDDFPTPESPINTTFCTGFWRFRRRQVDQQVYFWASNDVDDCK